MAQLCAINAFETKEMIHRLYQEGRFLDSIVLLLGTPDNRIFQAVEQTARNVNHYGPFFDLDLVACYTTRRFIRAVHPINIGVKYTAELFVFAYRF